MLASLLGYLALLHAPLPASRSALMRAPAVRAVAPPLDDVTDKVVGQVATNNPTDSFTGKLYDGKKEVPPVWGGIRVGTRRIVVVTGVRAPMSLSNARAATHTTCSMQRG